MTDQAQAVFDENVLAVLATVNDDGSPWAVPVHVATDGVYVYWFSHETAVHSQNITRDSRVSLSLFSPDESKGPKGVYVNGRAEPIAGEQSEVAREIFVKRIGTLPPVFATSHAYRLPLGQFSEEKSTGNCWYFYS
jgi:nitroimidazol reductase NimA-like FMN-containing flavoprotein (pyridoxamine 5'-phosphate oxidase superfamily)